LSSILAARWSTTSCASVCSPDTTQAEPHLTSNTQQTKNDSCASNKIASGI